MRRAGILFLLTFTFFAANFGQVSLAGAAPVTAHVMIPPIGTSLDPVSIPRSDYSARNLAENLFVGLTRYNPLSGQVEPALASDWSVSDDGLTYVFNLRKDIQWVTYNSLTQQV